MEEADVLGDNIGVMSHGKIQAFGSSTRLKKRFGSGYKMTVFIDNPLKEKEAMCIEDNSFANDWVDYVDEKYEKCSTSAE